MTKHFNVKLAYASLDTESVYVA